MRAGVYALGWDISVHLRYGEAATAQPRRDRPSRDVRLLPHRRRPLVLRGAARTDLLSPP